MVLRFDRLEDAAEHVCRSVDGELLDPLPCCQREESSEWVRYVRREPPEDGLMNLQMVRVQVLLL